MELKKLQVEEAELAAKVKAKRDLMNKNTDSLKEYCAKEKANLKKIKDQQLAVIDQEK